MGLLLLKIRLQYLEHLSTAITDTEFPDHHLAYEVVLTIGQDAPPDFSRCSFLPFLEDDLLVFVNFMIPFTSWHLQPLSQQTPVSYRAYADSKAHPDNKNW